MLNVKGQMSFSMYGFLLLIQNCMFVVGFSRLQRSARLLRYAKHFGQA
jgi:hypothetical protein